MFQCYLLYHHRNKDTIPCPFSKSNVTKASATAQFPPPPPLLVGDRGEWSEDCENDIETSQPGAQAVNWPVNGSNSQLDRCFNDSWFMHASLQLYTKAKENWSLPQTLFCSNYNFICSSIHVGVKFAGILPFGRSSTCNTFLFVEGIPATAFNSNFSVCPIVVLQLSWFDFSLTPPENFYYMSLLPIKSHDLGRSKSTASTSLPKFFNVQ